MILSNFRSYFGEYDINGQWGKAYHGEHASNDVKALGSRDGSHMACVI